MMIRVITTTNIINTEPKKANNGKPNVTIKKDRKNLEGWN